MLIVLKQTWNWCYDPSCCSLYTHPKPKSPFVMNMLHVDRAQPFVSLYFFFLHKSNWILSFSLLFSLPPDSFPLCLFPLLLSLSLFPLSIYRPYVCITLPGRWYWTSQTLTMFTICNNYQHLTNLVLPVGSAQKFVAVTDKQGREEEQQTNGGCVCVHFTIHSHRPLTHNNNTTKMASTTQYVDVVVAGTKRVCFYPLWMCVCVDVC